MKKQILSLIGITLTWIISATACNVVSTSTTKPTIIITSPPSNSQFREGDTVQVQSTAADPAGIVRVELSVDGNIVRTDPAPQPQPSFTVLQNWTAVPGTHTIMVRTINTANVASEPAAIVITVSAGTATPPATLTPVATATATATAQVSPTLPPTGVCTNNSTFIADVTVPDGTVMAPGQMFQKTWRIRNSGTCNWGATEQLVFTRGEAMTTARAIAIPATPPGGVVDVTVTLTAPTASGNHVSEWRLRSGSTFFGTNLVAVINVAGPTANNCPFTPVIQSFTASPTTITAGQSATLSWGAVIGAESAEIDNGIGGVATPGSTSVSPTATTTYTMIATCGSKVRTAQVTVTVQ